MAAATPNPAVDAWLDRASAWAVELRALRAIALGSGLREDLKWGKPCYTHEGKNIAILQPFREHCALMFFKGVLLDDPRGLLQAQGPNSHAARRLSFRSSEEIDRLADWIAKLLEQAVRLEEAGAELPPRDEVEELPAELEEMFLEVEGLEEAFGRLTPGRQRGYLLHFRGARLPATRRRRIEKQVPAILAGRGMHDR